jgi:hypothetical protein
MSEFLNTVLDGAAQIRWLRYVGLAQLARWLRRRMGRVMIGVGAKFFPSRDALNQSRDFNEFLGSAEEIDAIYVTGRVFIQDHHNRFRRIKRVIFPDPESNSFRFFAESTGETDLAECVRRATAVCRDQIKMEVRWCPEMVQQSVLIGDSKKRTGWVHAEIVLPCSKANSRPSFTVYKSRFSEVVDTYQEIFDRLWSLSKPAPLGVQPKAVSTGLEVALAKPLPNIYPSAVSLLTPGFFDKAWILNFNPANPRGRKRISFNKDGTIGFGRNQNEFRWQISNGMLEIYREAGTLQNRFRYDEIADRFVCTNDPNAVGYKDQTIYQEAIK